MKTTSKCNASDYAGDRCELTLESWSPAWCASIDAELAATEAEDCALNAELLAAARDDGRQFDSDSLEQAS